MFHDQQRKFRSAVAHHPVRDAVRPAVPGRRDMSGDDALDDLIRALRDERGLAVATLLGLRRSLTPFLAWLAARRRAWQDAALEVVTSYLASRPHWSRVTISRHVQCLRSLFRHAAVRGWVRPRLAEMIDALLDAPDRTTEQGRRDHGVLLFLYNTGTRASEAAASPSAIRGPARRAVTAHRPGSGDSLTKYEGSFSPQCLSGIDRCCPSCRKIAGE